MLVIKPIAILMIVCLGSITYAWGNHRTQHTGNPPATTYMYGNSEGFKNKNIRAAGTDAISPAGGKRSNPTTTGSSTMDIHVQFTDLSAKVNGDILFVNWSTASEKNNKSFDIEASSDKIHFITIGEMQSRDEDGNSTSVLSYEFSADMAGVSFAALGIAITLLALGSLAIGLPRKIRWVFAGIVLTGLLMHIAGYQEKNTEPVSGDTDAYIRIAQIDAGGEKTYSGIVTVMNNN